MDIKRYFLGSATAAIFLLGSFGAQAHSGGAAYTMTNAPEDNRIVVFSRDAQGILIKTDAVSTGGKGSGGGLDPLASQGSLVLADEGKWLLAVNAGSNDISVFRVKNDGIELSDRTGSGGSFPVSVTVSEHIVYVLNNGVPANITGFRLSDHGQLVPLPDSTRALGSGSFGQVAFDAQRKSLVVTDKANNRLLVYRTREHGLPDVTPVVSASAGNVPFGVAFDRVGHLLAVEAGSNAVSSYDLLRDGSLQTITASAANGQIATCWIVVNQRGDVITTNPGTHSLSAFHVDAQTGAVTLLNGLAGAGDRPLDIDVSKDGRFVYAVDPANGGVDMFKIEHDGSLTGMGNVDGGLPLFAQGMAVR
ncbi:MAG: beta-propeller fold lactonase family protein [Gammaproteobacteria bacterium]|nr:beta-propeller fold lactonase family protein [Gammaproteobacteria bacterium]